jgi:hypothetical protein
LEVHISWQTSTILLLNSSQGSRLGCFQNYFIWRVIYPNSIKNKQDTASKVFHQSPATGITLPILKFCYVVSLGITDISKAGSITNFLDYTMLQRLSVISNCFIFRNHVIFYVKCKYVLTINSIRTGTEYLNLSQLVCIRCSYFYVVIYQVDTTETRAPLAPSQNRQPESVNSISNSVTPTEHKPLSYTVWTLT